VGVLLTPGSERDIWRDVGPYDGPFVLAALACGWRASRQDRERPGWPTGAG